MLLRVRWNAGRKRDKETGLKAKYCKQVKERQKEKEEESK
jgi:hypothetical protein